MERASLSAAGVVDEAVAAVARTVAPWLGVLWLTGLPYRLMLVYLVREALALGGHSRRYGDYLLGISAVALAALAAALLGRLVFARAVHLSVEQGRSPGPEAARVGPARALSLLYVSLPIEMLFAAVLALVAPAPVATADPAAAFELAFRVVATLLFLPPLLLLPGLAVATAHLVERPGLVRSFRPLLAAAGSKRTLVGLTLVFACAVVIAWVNLFLIAHAALWTAQGLSGAALPAWEHLLRPVAAFLPFPAEPMTAFMLYVGVSMAVEPFWLAALAVYVYRLKMRETGDDLRRWFVRLRAGCARASSSPRDRRGGAK